MNTIIVSGRTSGRKGIKSAILGTASTAAILLLAGAAQAQSSSDVEQVVVTGSRISIPGYQSPTPITALSAADLSVKAASQVQDLMNEIPQLTPFTGVSTGSLNAGLATLNLRGVGALRNLVLVNGRRFTNTTPLGGVDTGVLPASLITSMSVVTGGSSAAYGSDAVSGVVNVTLDDRFTGFKAGLSGGGSAHMDDMELGGYVGAGISFANGRGHLVVAGDAYTNNGFLQGDRKWGSQGYAIIGNPNCGATCPTGQVKNVFVNDVSLSKTSDGGVIVSGPLKYVSFGPGGTIQKFQPGTVVGTNFMSGGDGTNEIFHGGLSDNLYASVEDRMHRNSAFSRLSYDVTDDITVWGDMLYAEDLNFYYLIPNYNNAGDLTVTRQNAFLPTAVASLMDSNKITSFAMGRANDELGWNGAEANATTQRYSFGIDGNVHAFGSAWKWSAYFQNSDNNYYFFQKNNRKEQAWKDSVDSVINPAVGGVAGVAAGTPVCRIDLPSSNTTYNLLNPQGCVPVNLFGFGGYGSSPQYPNGGPTTWSPALINYVEGTDWYNETNVENDAAVNVSGSPFEDWAGPVSIAFGAEHRFEGTSGTSDPLSQSLGWKLVNAIPLVGKYTVDEGYIETDIPLAKDQSWARSLDIDLAGRITSYTTSGTVETWKASFNWQVFDDLRIRGTRSADIRAATTSELFTARAQNSSSITNPANNAQLQAYVVNGGNPNLKPETGNTYTVGAVYQPSWLDGFSVSADWTQLHISNAIITPGFQGIVNACFGGQTQFCSQVTTSNGAYNAASVIQFVFATATNAQSIKTNALDLESSYNFAVDDFFKGVAGDVRLHATASWTPTLTTTTPGATGALVTEEFSGGGNGVSGTGGVSNLPHWRWTGTATYTLDPWTFSVEGRWVGNSAYNLAYVQGVDIASNKVDGRFLLNMTTQYQFTDNIQLYLRVHNLFDTDPPLTPGTTNVVHAVGSTLYDTVGRDFLLGVRLNY